MPGLDCFVIVGVLVGSAHLVLAYVGLGPGQELFPYFMALLGLVGAALVSILQWPLSVLYRLFSRGKGSPAEVPPAPAEVPPEAPAEARSDAP